MRFLLAQTVREPAVAGQRQWGIYPMGYLCILHPVSKTGPCQ